jgi:hypothetical protein
MVIHLIQSFVKLFFCNFLKGPIPVISSSSRVLMCCDIFIGSENYSQTCKKSAHSWTSGGSSSDTPTSQFSCFFFFFDQICWEWITCANHYWGMSPIEQCNQKLCESSGGLLLTMRYLDSHPGISVLTSHIPSQLRPKMEFTTGLQEDFFFRYIHAPRCY